MDSDEREIFDYLKGWPGHFVSTTEIARRAGGKRKYRENPHWAHPVLSRMVEQGLLESDALGHFRVKAADERTTRRKRWISPHIARILEQSGKNFDTVINVDDSDA